MKAAYIVLGALGVATIGYIVYKRRAQPVLQPTTTTQQPLTKAELVLQQTINEVLSNPAPGSQPVILRNSTPGIEHQVTETVSQPAIATELQPVVRRTILSGFNGLLI